MKRLIYVIVLLSANIAVAYSGLAVQSLPDNELEEAKSDSAVRVIKGKVYYASPYKREYFGDTVKISGRIYSNLDGYDAHLIVEAWYDKNSKKPFDYKISGYSFNGTPVAFKPIVDNGMSQRVSMEQIKHLIKHGTLPADVSPREVPSKKISLTTEQKAQLDDIMTEQAEYPWVSNSDKLDEVLASVPDCQNEVHQKKSPLLYNNERVAFNGVVLGTLEFVLPNGEIMRDEVGFTFFIDA